MFVLKRNVTGNQSCQRLRKAVQRNNIFATKTNGLFLFLMTSRNIRKKELKNS